MGLFGWLSRQVPCSFCGDPGARQGLFGRPKCPNPNCRYFSGALPPQEGASTEVRPRRDPFTGRKMQPRPVVGNFDAGPHRIEVAYRNFRGEEKTFVGDRRTLRRRNRHVSLQVEPTGIRIALALDRLRNASEVEYALSANVSGSREGGGRSPTSRERRVLSFHSRRGSTSDLYEELRRKYPDW